MMPLWPVAAPAPRMADDHTADAQAPAAGFDALLESTEGETALSLPAPMGEGRVVGADSVEAEETEDLPTLATDALPTAVGMVPGLNVMTPPEAGGMADAAVATPVVTVAEGAAPALQAAAMSAPPAYTAAPSARGALGDGVDGLARQGTSAGPVTADPARAGVPSSPVDATALGPAQPAPQVPEPGKAEASPPPEAAPQATGAAPSGGADAPLPDAASAPRPADAIQPAPIRPGQGRSAPPRLARGQDETPAPRTGGGQVQPTQPDAAPEQVASVDGAPRHLDAATPDPQPAPTPPSDPSGPTVAKPAPTAPQAEARADPPALPAAQVADPARAIASAPVIAPHAPPRSALVQAALDRIGPLPAVAGETVVRLNPKGLGLIEVVIQDGKDGALDIVLRVQNPLVLEAMRQERDAVAQALTAHQGSGSGALAMDLFQSGAGQRGGQNDGQTGGQPGSRGGPADATPDGAEAATEPEQPRAPALGRRGDSVNIVA